MAITVNSFTIIDAFNQFWEVWEVSDRRSLTCIGLYFYLVKKWNACGRPNDIRLQNNLICAELELSKPTMNRVRNQLKQWGLIEFYSKGKGDSNITYRVLEIVKPPPAGSKKNLLLEADIGKKEKNFTSHVTSDFTSRDSLKQSTELEIVISGEVKNFNYLKDLFTADAGLKLAWEQRYYPADQFQTGVERWMIQNHGKPYVNFQDARKHFLFWMPNYQKEQHQQNGVNQPEKQTRSVAQSAPPLKKI